MPAGQTWRLDRERILKRPRIGDSILYIAGYCRVLKVMEDGRRLEIDGKYRGIETVERAANGHWTVKRAGAAKIPA